MARGPLSNERLVLTSSEFLEKLAAIVPPPRAPPRCESVMLEFDTADPALETVSDLTPDLTTDLATQAADPGWD